MSTRRLKKGSPQSHSVSSSSRGVPAFVSKLYEQVTRAELSLTLPNCLVSRITSNVANREHIRWSNDGKSFIVFDTEQFRAILGIWFTHRNFGTFIRQLHNYAFHKIPAIRLTHTRCPASDDYQFANPFFRRGEPQLLRHIRGNRKSHPKRLPQTSPLISPSTAVTTVDTPATQLGPPADFIADVDTVVRQAVQDTRYTQWLVESQLITVDYLSEYLNRISDRLANVSLVTGASVNVDTADGRYQTGDLIEPRGSSIMAERELPRRSHSDLTESLHPSHLNTVAGYLGSPQGPPTHTSPLPNTPTTPMSLPFDSSTNIEGSSWYPPASNLYQQPMFSQLPNTTFWPLSQPCFSVPVQVCVPDALLELDPGNEDMRYTVDGSPFVEH